MTDEQIFPTLMILLSFLASAAYLAQGKLSHCVYWLLAALLTFVVTFFMKST